MPLVSIVTPTLNSEKYLCETIESIHCQTYKNIEHIVVDGGSTDNTIELIKNYKKIKLIHTKIPGMYAAINLGLKSSKGKLVCYLNSDDLFADNSVVEKIVEKFLNNPKTNWIYGNCEFIDENGCHLKTSKAPFFNYKLFSSLSGMNIFQPATFWRKVIHDKFGYFNEKYKLASDFDFFLRIGRLEKPIRLGGKALAKFRYHKDGLSSKFKSTDKNEVFSIKNDHGIKPSVVYLILSVISIKLYNVHKLFRWLK